MTLHAAFAQLCFCLWLVPSKAQPDQVKVMLSIPYLRIRLIHGLRHQLLITGDCCCNCHRDGNKLRVLPCKHRFHIECIDQWLSSRKPLCPICKWDATEPFTDAERGLVAEPEPDESPVEAEAEAPSSWRSGLPRLRSVIMMSALVAC